MSAADAFEFDASERLRTQALELPEVEEGSSCVNRAFKAGGKNFAFVGERRGDCTLRLKLRDALPEVEALAERQPDRYEVGSGGWTLVVFPPDDPPNADQTERWITESYRLLAPKRLSRELG